MDRTHRFPIAPDDELQLSAAQVEVILAERAARLAVTYVPSTDADIEHVHLIAFSRGEHRYGIELAYLSEIRPVTRCTPVPGVPPFYVGVIHVRGDIIAVLDIAVLFGREPGIAADEQFAIVVSAGDVTAGLLADSVDDVHDLQPGRIHPPLTTFTDRRERYISGLSQDGVSILDVDKLLHDERLWVRQETSEERR
ncbi:MAG: purine-binding chemotaxis protein CheW [Acidobacteria bacterium]|nr:purine-binding chemotaxis protein CheW [Acidobacteriota bacterium]